jgi:hypothetical protein
MIQITPATYRHIAAILKERIATAEWINTSISLELPPPLNLARSDGRGDLVSLDTPPTAIKSGNAAGRGGAVSPTTPPTAIKSGNAANAANAVLTLTAIVYRRTERLPEGTRRPIADIVPVWWEFSTVIEDILDDSDDAPDDAPDRRHEGQCLNDFSFAELKTYLIEND